MNEPRLDIIQFGELVPTEDDEVIDVEQELSEESSVTEIVPVEEQNQEVSPMYHLGKLLEVEIMKIGQLSNVMDDMGQVLFQPENYVHTDTDTLMDLFKTALMAKTQSQSFILKMAELGQKEQWLKEFLMIGAKAVQEGTENPEADAPPSRKVLEVKNLLMGIIQSKRRSDILAEEEDD